MHFKFITSRNRPEDPKRRFTPPLHVDKPTNHRIQQNNKDAAQGIQEKQQALMLRALLRRIRKEPSNEVKSNKGADPHSSVERRLVEMLPGVEENEIRRFSAVNGEDAQEGGDLANADGDGGAGHESRQGSEGD